MKNKKLIIGGIILIIIAGFLFWPDNKEDDSSSINVNIPSLPADAQNLNKDELRKLYQQNNSEVELSEEELEKAQNLYGDLQNGDTSSTTPKEFEPSEDVCKMFGQVPDCSSVPDVIKGICMKCISH